jgi:hypothetical protein
MGLLKDVTFGDSFVISNVFVSIRILILLEEVQYHVDPKKGF